MAQHTTRRWSGLAEMVDAEGTTYPDVRVHIEQSRSIGAAGDGDSGISSWEGALLGASTEPGVVTGPLLEQLVGLCSLQLANGRKADVVVRIDGSFVGVGPCPVDMF